MYPIGIAKENRASKRLKATFPSHRQPETVSQLFGPVSRPTLSLPIAIRPIGNQNPRASSTPVGPLNQVIDSRLREVKVLLVLAVVAMHRVVVVVKHFELPSSVVIGVKRQELRLVVDRMQSQVSNHNAQPVWSVKQGISHPTFDVLDR